MKEVRLGPQRITHVHTQTTRGFRSREIPDTSSLVHTRPSSPVKPGPSIPLNDDVGILWNEPMDSLPFPEKRTKVSTLCSIGFHGLAIHRPKMIISVNGFLSGSPTSTFCWTVRRSWHSDVPNAVQTGDGVVIPASDNLYSAPHVVGRSTVTSRSIG